uniref:Uncharacterized protein n=1 Tax=Romanomermis culicivorax TaxID=13658 RepID=A0A915J747_ROMCU
MQRKYKSKVEARKEKMMKFERPTILEILAFIGSLPRLAHNCDHARYSDRLITETRLYLQGMKEIKRKICPASDNNFFATNKNLSDRVVGGSDYGSVARRKRDGRAGRILLEIQHAVIRHYITHNTSSTQFGRGPYGAPGSMLAILVSGNFFHFIRRYEDEIGRFDNIMTS